MRTVVLLELSQLWHRLGGSRGLLMIGAVAALGVLLPMRLGPALLDPAYLLAYSLLAAVFSGTYSIQSWAGSDERAWLENRGDDGPTDTEVLRGKNFVASLYGITAWAVILGASLAALANLYNRAFFPPLAIFAALTLFTLSLSAVAASGAAMLAVRFETPALARQMFRLALFFFVVAGIILTRAFPAIGSAISDPDAVFILLLAAPAVLIGLAGLFGWLTLRSLADRRVSLSIKS